MIIDKIQIHTALDSRTPKRDAGSLLQAAKPSVNFEELHRAKPESRKSWPGQKDLPERMETALDRLTISHRRLGMAKREAHEAINTPSRLWRWVFKWKKQIYPTTDCGFIGSDMTPKGWGKIKPVYASEDEYRKEQQNDQWIENTMEAG